MLMFFAAAAGAAIVVVVPTAASMDARVVTYIFYCHRLQYTSGFICIGGQNVLAWHIS